ncbi:Protein ALP1-like [Merluccius polli]|uniref:Protein ALP1-like n=1 Tax=Merluccius polli TaxID=89951 RepID=A0AA47PAS3_MERPO|nr:Protein ALP1-like [Merluccius polli]
MTCNTPLTPRVAAESLVFLRVTFAGDIPGDIPIKMATEEECILLLLLNRRRQRRQRRDRRWYVRPLNTTRDQDGEFVSLVLPMRSLDEERHFQYFRMSAPKFDDLVSRVIRYLPDSHQNHRNPIGASQRLAVTLRYLATGIGLQALSASYKMGTSTVSGIVEEMCSAIWDALQGEYMAFPSRVTSIITKVFFSIVLMAAADANYRFVYVDVGAYGRESDGGVLGRSAFGSRLAEGNLNLPAPAVLPGTTTPSPFFFLGDEAFPLQVNLMRPYPGTNLQDRKRIYNYRLSRARRVVENAFGILAARFRIFGRPIDCQPEKAVKIVKACVALHNFLASTERARYMPATFVDTTADTGEVQPGEWRQHVAGDRNMVDGPRCSVGRARPSQRAALVREQLADYFLSDAGVFPNQYNVLRLGTDQ